MRIAMVMAGNEEGGLEKHVEELVNGLAGRGHEVFWIAHGKYADRVRGGALFVPIDMSRSRRHPLALFQLWRALRRIRPDIIHSHGGKALAMTSSLHSGLHAATITTVHGIKKRHAGITRADAVISPNRQLGAAIKHPAIHVVYHGILYQTAPAGSASVTSDGPAFWLAVGRLVREKGFDVLIRAMADVPGRLLIAGDGPERGNLETLARNHGLADRVTLLGHRDDIPELMRQCQALVIASRREGFSYVFAEALFNRCPVVSTNVPIPNEVLPPHRICPVDDAAALEALMNGLRPDPALTESLYQYARAHLTLDSMLDNTLAVYETTLQRRAS
ncbi:MAG TPA: glycosyltransferase [Marinobacter sp.]|nr:glycosyltransferase [Marinobacter sp.]